ncbi:hypothetical protein HPB51_028630 [Rhipicephalus microplus]|uniref:Uncharacterized protein n=1 Tax=Rhipicephalus microplus TaxID=6941 RepID=A0A9J6CWD4_RHIMP|nr:hypothetical protein HPB51_028630 [Rhipicephalus microplus]
MAIKCKNCGMGGGGRIDLLGIAQAWLIPCSPSLFLSLPRMEEMESICKTLSRRSLPASCAYRRTCKALYAHMCLLFHVASTTDGPCQRSRRCLAKRSARERCLRAPRATLFVCRLRARGHHGRLLRAPECAAVQPTACPGLQPEPRLVREPGQRPRRALPGSLGAPSRAPVWRGASGRHLQLRRQVAPHQGGPLPCPAEEPLRGPHATGTGVRVRGLALRWHEACAADPGVPHWLQLLGLGHHPRAACQG